MADLLLRGLSGQLTSTHMLILLGLRAALATAIYSATKLSTKGANTLHDTDTDHKQSTEKAWTDWIHPD